MYVLLLNKICTLPQEYINCRLFIISIIRIDVVLEISQNFMTCISLIDILRNAIMQGKPISLLRSQVYLHLVGGFFLFFSQSLSQFISLRMLLLSPCCPIICFTERGRYLSTHNKLGSPKQFLTLINQW